MQRLTLKANDTSFFSIFQNDQPLTLTSHYDAGDDKVAVEISIRLIKDVHRTETGYLQVIVMG